MTNGFGGLLAFDVGETIDDAKKFISNLTTIFHAVSLGATESLICIPFLTTMLYMPPERRTTAPWVASVIVNVNTPEIERVPGRHSNMRRRRSAFLVRSAGFSP